jgi:hypothetical protein
MPSLRTLLIGFIVTLCATRLSAFTIAQFNTASSENFDSLELVTSSTVPAGWEFSETGSSANTTYGAGTGSSSTGNTYSFGAAGSTDRALGSVRTSGVASTFGTIVTNATGNTITDLLVAFTGEQWRLGALGRVDQLDFAYSVDATSVATGSWSDVDALDFIGPTTAGVTGALDGNAPENQQIVTHTISGLSLANGSSLWLRWVDFDASGSDDGLAIDNFSITALEISPPDQGGGTPQAVPDSLPTSTIAMALGVLLMLASKAERLVPKTRRS